MAIHADVMRSLNRMIDIIDAPSREVSDETANAMIAGMSEQASMERKPIMEPHDAIMPQRASLRTEGILRRETRAVMAAPSPSVQYRTMK